MITERIVSHYYQIKTCRKTSLLEETINNRLFVSLNLIGTVHPLLAIIEILNEKNGAIQNRILVLIIKIVTLLADFFMKKNYFTNQYHYEMFFELLFVIYYKIKLFKPRKTHFVNFVHRHVFM